MSDDAKTIYAVAEFEGAEFTWASVVRLKVSADKRTILEPPAVVAMIKDQQFADELRNMLVARNV